MKLNLPIKNHAGFTLVELLIVIAILAALAAIIFPKAAKFGADNDLKIAALEYASIIRLAQAEAISGDLCGTTTNPQYISYNWHFGAIAESDFNSYYYHPFCSIAGYLSIPEYDYKYPSGIYISKINAYKSDSTPYPCNSNNRTEVSFNNISGEVHFANYYNVDPCDERISLIDPVSKFSTTSPWTKIQYVLKSSKTSSTYSIYISKSGDITESIP